MPDGWIRKAVAEAIGAFALVFVVTLVITSSGDDLGATALAYGLTMAVFVAALAHVSGGHFNPAVTLAMYLSRVISLRGALTYWLAQLSGGLMAALVVLMATDQEVVTAGAPALADGVGLGEAVVLEAVATFFLVLVVYGTVIDGRAPFSAYPFAIGFVMTVGVFAIGPLTGGALNPARGLGPALFGVEWSAAAAWLAGPLIGGVLAWAVYEFVIAPRPVPETPADDISAAGIIPGLETDDDPALTSATPVATRRASLAKAAMNGAPAMSADESSEADVDDAEVDTAEPAEADTAEPAEADVAEDEDTDADEAEQDEAEQDEAEQDGADEAEAEEAETDDADSDEADDVPDVHEKAATAAGPE